MPTENRTEKSSVLKPNRKNISVFPENRSVKTENLNKDVGCSSVTHYHIFSALMVIHTSPAPKQRAAAAMTNCFILQDSKGVYRSNLINIHTKTYQDDS